MDSTIEVLIISMSGLGILAFCILSFFFPYGERFKGKIQKIKGLGVELEISIFTLFIIAGVTLTLTSVYLQIKDYENLLSVAKQNEEAANIALAKSFKMEMRIVISLEGVGNDDIPNLNDVACEYFLPGTDECNEADVIIGYIKGTFKIILKDITPKTHITRLEFIDKATDRKWITTNFMPLEPMFTMRKE